MACSLFVTARTADLAREVESRNLLAFERRVELRGVDGIVLHRVADLQDLRAGKPRNRVDGRKLDVGRKARTETIDIDATDVRLFRFKEKLMAIPVTEPVDLVFDTRAVARPLSVDAPAEHRAILETAPQYLVRLEVRARNPANAIVAYKLVRLVAPEIVRIAARDSFRQMAVAHRPRSIVAVLHVAFVKIDCVRVKPAGRSRLETTQRNPFTGKAFRKFVRTRFPHAPADARFKPGKHLGGKEGPARNHEGTRHIAIAVQ